MKFRPSRIGARQCALILSLLLLSRTVFAQDDNEQEPAAIVEIGAAPSWSITEPGSSIGPTVAMEMTPIKNWLELEMGLTSSLGRHSTEWSTDLLFKKPWDLSRKIEFMVGIGPEWINTRKFGVTTNSLAGEAVLDFMFWTNAKHRLGWYFEPAYDYSFHAGHERSMGASIGLLIGIR
jgi:hypothetical protein